MADYNPFAPGDMNPNMARNGLYDLRMMSAANRSEQPFMHMPHSYPRMGQNPMLASLLSGGTDYSQFTYNPQAHQAASDALAPYGLAPLEANQVQQNTILPNTGFFGNHPRLSHALEAGMYGVMASHGGNTIGESMQGTLEGLVGGRQLQQAAYNRQFARPFEASTAMERLEDLQQRRDLQGAQIKHYNDESEIQQERVRIEQQKYQNTTERALATRPYADPVTGQTYTFQEGGPPSLNKDMLVSGGQPGWRPLEGTGPGQIQRHAGSAMQDPWKGKTKYQGIIRAHGWDPSQMDAAQWAQADAEWQQQQVDIAGGKSKAVKRAQQGAGGLTDTQKEDLKPVDNELEWLKSKEANSQFRQKAAADIAAGRVPKGTSLLDRTEQLKTQRRQELEQQRSKIKGAAPAPPEASSAGLPAPVAPAATDFVGGAGGKITNAQGDPSLIGRKIVPPGTPKRGVGPNYIEPGGNQAKPSAGTVVTEQPDGSFR